MGIGFSAYVFAMYHTTIANTLFIISTEIFFLALFGYIFLKEKINLVTLISIIMGMSGVLLIIGSSLSIQSSSQFFGNIVAFIMPISFCSINCNSQKISQKWIWFHHNLSLEFLLP